MNIKLSGLPRSGIRYYEAEGLLEPLRLPNGYRDYSEADLQTLLKIKRLRGLGLTLAGIRRVQASSVRRRPNAAGSCSTARTGTGCSAYPAIRPCPTGTSC